jgi:hypothetical protein
MGDKTSGNHSAAERKLRGDALMGSERKAAADHAEYEKTRTPDSELHLDGEEDNLGSDGLDIGDDSDTLFGTRGKSRGIIKP